jgi:two-component system NtrC family response regulator
VAADKKHLLIVEDYEGLRNQLRWCFEDFEVLLCGEREDAINQLRRHQPGVVLLDLGLPPDPGGVTEGLATLDEILSLAPETKTIVVTGDSDRANAIAAIGRGAYDFYQKPVEPGVLGLIVDRAQRVHELESENRRLQQFGRASPLDGIIASSPQMLKVCRMVEKVAPSDITTLLRGASGTGKELVSRVMRQLSTRARMNMVAINCAAIPETLLESELFGYEQGAFTGATQQTIGKLERANGSTLFLDEIGDLSPGLQAKLLRFLQERVIERLGGRKDIPIDVRIICATHQDLPRLIAEGKFREDLCYRISEITIDIPDLKDRDGDAIMLARAFLEKFNRDYKGKVRGFDKAATLAIEQYHWPGNVREMESCIKRAVVMADNTLLGLDDLELEMPGAASMPFNLRQVREDAESRAVVRALQSCGGNVSEAARVLGITRPTLYSLMERYHLKP